MGTNPDKPVDAELEAAQRSMGSRVDSDAKPAEETVATDPVEKKDEPAAPVAEPSDPGKPAEEPAKPAEVPVDPKDKKPEDPAPKRPERFIPLDKYHDEQRNWEKSLEDKDSELAKANDRIKELETLAGQKDGDAKDEKIERFMDKTGFSRETVEELLELTKRDNTASPLSPEEKDAVAKATAIVQAAEMEEAYNTEFAKFGEPALKKQYPNATPEQIAKAKDALDEIAHAKGNGDKPLDLLILRNQDVIGKLFEGGAAAPVAGKHTVEQGRIGQGKNSVLTAADFKDGKTDFAMLGELDPAVRSKIINEFDTKTYQSFLQHVKGQNSGVEVMRNGQKVILK